MTSLRAGDLVWADFEPVRGTEQGGRRPAIVLTDAGFNSRDQRSVVCPITQNLSPWPTKVVLPPGLRTRGAILVDQIRNMHREERGFRFIEHAPEAVLEEVRAVLRSILSLGD